MAINNASRLVEKDGLFIISVYKKTKFCGIWKAIKRLYSSNGFFVRIPLTLAFLTPLFLGKIILGKQISRGMHWYYDAIDWLGGYPYESASPRDVQQFVTALGFTNLFIRNTENIVGLFGSSCAEYVFKKH
jgi:2-polyprenyl-6-hydroxyphenyl methylase/3-demethylubiquinone-9 3-methyltransferase